MNQNLSFIRFSKVVLVTVFLVIIAGGVVRTTQSGMGCPDWPKCFGKWVPPVTASDLPANYESYLKQQDIDHHFNVFHTWTEYINRLLGALLGLFLLIQFATSLRYWKTNRKIVWLCLGLLLLTGFQGWLGKKVVDANLASVKITTHMLVALFIAALALTIIHLLTAATITAGKKLRNISLVALVLLVVQIVMGTQVREQIDSISKSLDYDNREYWIGKLDYIFYVHRSFSLVVTAACLYVYFLFKKAGVNIFSNFLVVVCVLGEVAAGVIMAYLNIPAFAQPVHLLLSSILFVALYNNWLTAARSLQ